MHQNGELFCYDSRRPVVCPMAVTAVLTQSLLSSRDTATTP